MALLPESVVDPVATAIFDAYKSKHSTEPARGYLGASSIGKSCSRALWYGFRWVKPADFTGRLYRLFQSGHLQEPRVVADLQAIGCTVFDVNPADNLQWGFVEPTNKHFRGNCDGIVTGVPGAEKTIHILEIKTSADKGFKAMQKHGVEKSKPEHFAQMQIYMRWSLDRFGVKDGCKRALYVVVNKNTDDIYTERITYNPEFAQALIDKAVAIIESEVPPVGVSIDPDYFECRFCDYKDICHGSEIAAVNCRTCAHSTATPDGRWECTAHTGTPDKNPVLTLCEEAQRQGCQYHIYIPALLSSMGKPVDSDGWTVTYVRPDGTEFINGDFYESSAKIFKGEE